MLRPAPTRVGLEEADLSEYTLARQEALRAREAQQAQAQLQQLRAQQHQTPAWPPKPTLTAAQRIGLAPPSAASAAAGAGAGGR
jgi:hypothetical protein